MHLKIRIISLFIATAAIISACCGIFYVQNLPEKSETFTEKAPQTLAFSLDRAKKSLRLCALAGYPVSLEAKLNKENFTDVEFFQYENMRKTDNKAGIVLSHKEKSLLAVIRGTKDEEWYSNFYIGDGAEHAGFSKAADLVISNIKDYASRKNLDLENTRIFLTGHSRGAAVANLAAARLIDENIFTDVFAYTFACPATTKAEVSRNEKYSNIINIVNPQDFICYIPLPSWGYTRFGQTVEFPTKASTPNFDELYSNMQKEYLHLKGTTLRDFPNKEKDVQNIISYLSDIAPTPEDYYEKEITVGSFRLTMYDYMMKLAAVMSGENPLLHGLFMLSCNTIPEVCPITEFVFNGLTEEELKTTTSLDNTPVVANHMHEAYFAWLNTLPETYFTSRIHN